jgi:hypothetical protein
MPTRRAVSIPLTSTLLEGVARTKRHYSFVEDQRVVPGTMSKKNADEERAEAPKDPTEGCLSLRKKNQSIQPTIMTTRSNDTRANPITFTDAR